MSISGLALVGLKSQVRFFREGRERGERYGQWIGYVII